MITPAYSLTATERVLPRMALDFTTGVLDSRVTIARLLNTATRVNISGLIEIVNANLPRFDYDPATLAPRGLLIEEARTNIALQSGAVNTSPWAFGGTTGGTITAPDGSASGRLLSTTGTSSLSQTIVVTTVAHTISIFVKAATASTNIVLRFAQASGGSANSVRLNAVTGVVTNSATEPFTSVGVQAYGNGWYRVFGRGTATTVDGRFQVFPNGGIGGFAANASGDAYFWGAQLEIGTFATSYIPTTTTSLTRNADIVSMTGTNFSSWYNASEGTFLHEAEVPAVGTQVVMQADNGTQANRITGRYSGTTSSFAVQDLNVSQVSLTSGTATPNIPYKSVLAYKQDNFCLSWQGLSPVTDALGTVPTVDRFRIGSNAVNTELINGRVRRIFYWPQRLTNAEAQAFSK